MSKDLEINQHIPGFDYEKLTVEQKQAVDELLRLIAERYEKIDFGHLRATFKLEEKKYYDLDESEFCTMVKKAGMIVDTQGYVKNGLGADAIHYPVISITSDVRNFEKVMNEYKKNIVDFVNSNDSKNNS